MSAGRDPAASDAPTRLGPGLLLRRIWAHLRPYRAHVWMIFALLLVDAGCSSALALGLKFLIDYAIEPRDRSYLVLVLLLLAVGVVLSCCAAVARDYLYANVGSRVLNDLRLKLFDQLQRLSAEFYARAQAGDVLARFSTDLAAVESTVSSVLPYGLLATINIAFGLVVLFTLQWRLALLPLIGVPLCLIGPRLLAPRAAEAGYRMKQEEAGVAGAAQEFVQGHAVARAFGLNDALRVAFVTRLTRLLSHARRFGFLSGLVQRVPNLAIDFVHLAVLATGAVMAFNGSLTVGSLVAFDLVFMNFAAGVSNLTDTVPSFLRAAGGMQRIEELLQETPTVTDVAEPEPMPRLSRSIAFRDVSFGYGRDKLDVDSVSFEILRGWSVAFVGRSGCGKSTLLNLLVRFYDPASGTVTVDGVDLRRVRQSDLRATIGVVLQDSFLFDATIRENVLAGKRDATDAEIEAAARAAELHDFVAGLPKGYDAPVGERGGRLSGGQRQRLALARALVRDPAILVLDEATSALDGATEAAIDRTLAAASRDRTVVSVTHRLASVVGADRIFVMDGGRLVEQGRHDELLRKNGAYAGLWRKQHGFEVSADGTNAAVTTDRLRLIPLFHDVDETLLAEAARRFASETAPALRPVIEEGDPGDRFYLIVRGRAVVTRRDASGIARTVAVLETGDHFGEIALLRNVPRTATVRTLSPCLLLVLRADQFLDLLERAPGLRERLEAVAGLRAAAERENRLDGAAPNGL